MTSESDTLTGVAPAAGPHNPAAMPTMSRRGSLVGHMSSPRDVTSHQPPAKPSSRHQPTSRHNSVDRGVTTANSGRSQMPRIFIAPRV